MEEGKDSNWNRFRFNSKGMPITCCILQFGNVFINKAWSCNFHIHLNLTEMLGRYINFFILVCLTGLMSCSVEHTNLHAVSTVVIIWTYHLLTYYPNFITSYFVCLYMSYNLSANFAFWSLSYTCTFKTNLSLIIKRRFLYIFQHNLDLKSSSTSGRNSTWRMEKTRTVAMTT